MPNSKNIYRTESLDSLPSSDQFTDYIHQPKLKWWIITFFLSTTMIAVLVWAFIARVPIVTVAKGIVNKDNTISCFVPITNFSGENARAKITSIKINGETVQANIILKKQLPLSENEAKELLNSEWLYENLVTASYSYLINIKLDNSHIYQPGSFCNVALTSGTEAPIMLLLR